MRSRTGWTFAITSVALFMVALDNLVVTTALPVIKADLGASLSALEWMVNAYTLTFAVLLLTGAALGDRFGRRRMFIVGLVIFTAGSAAAALAPSSDILILARAIQGVGGAFVTPLSLTILSAAVPPERRAVALGAWGGIAGLAIAIGPLVGGAIAEGVNWHWIFWLNVPIGIVAIVLATFRLEESYGPDGALDLVGLGLVSTGLLALVWGVIHGNELGWTDPQIVGALGAGAILMALFFVWESRTASPMLPLRFFRSRGFTAANVVSFLMYFGVFGAVFLLVQFFQVVQGLSPFQSGLRTLPWTAMPAIVAPIAGVAGRAHRRSADPRRRDGRAGGRARLDRGRRSRRPSSTPCSCPGSSSRASGWACSSRRSPTSSCRRSIRSRRARRRAPRTRSARSVACSGWPSWPACSRRTARTPRRRPSSTGSCRRSGSVPRSSPSGPSSPWHSRVVRVARCCSGPMVAWSPTARGSS